MEILFPILNHFLALDQHLCPAGYFLTECQRNSILHVGASDFDGMHVFFTLCSKGSCQFINRAIEVFMKDSYSCYMHGCGECIIG